MKINDKVKNKFESPAYYSNYGDNPLMLIEKDSIGEIKAIVPSVIRESVNLFIVDFPQKDGKMYRGSFLKKELNKM